MEHGKVTTSNYKDGVAYCDVRAIRVGVTYTDVPVMKPHSGFIQVPKQGERVTMEKLDDGTRFISNVLSRVREPPENVGRGELSIQLDGGTRLHFEEKKDGTHDIQIEASGDVYIDGTNFSEHTHQYDDSTISDTDDGSGSESTESLSTGAPE